MFKEVLAELLEIKGVSAYKLAKDTGISQGLIGDYKQGRSEPTGKNLAKFAEYFDVTIDYLLGNNKKAKFLVNNGNNSGIQTNEYNEFSETTKTNSSQQDEITIEILRLIKEFSLTQKAELLIYASKLEKTKKENDYE